MFGAHGWVKLVKHMNHVRYDAGLSDFKQSTEDSRRAHHWEVDYDLRHLWFITTDLAVDNHHYIHGSLSCQPGFSDSLLSTAPSGD